MDIKAAFLMWLIIAISFGAMAIIILSHIIESRVLLAVIALSASGLALYAGKLIDDKCHD